MARLVFARLAPLSSVACVRDVQAVMLGTNRSDYVFLLKIKFLTACRLNSGTELLVCAQQAIVLINMMPVFWIARPMKHNILESVFVKLTISETNNSFVCLNAQKTKPISTGPVRYIAERERNGRALPAHAKNNMSAPSMISASSNAQCMNRESMGFALACLVFPEILKICVPPIDALIRTPN